MKIRGSSEYGSSSAKNQPPTPGTVKPGIYGHFKTLHRREYEVIGVAVNRDSLPSIVIYKALGGDEQLEYRVLEEFIEHIERSEYSGPRFIFLRDTD